MDNIMFECPVCKVKLNSNGEPFTSVRAISLHVANKIKANRSDHLIWAYESCGQAEIDKALAEYRATDNNNVLAKLLYLPVNRWHNERGKPNIGFKK